MARLSKSGLGMALGLSLLGATPEVTEQSYAEPACICINSAHHVITSVEMSSATKLSQDVSTSDYQQSMERKTINFYRIMGVGLASFLALGVYLNRNEQD